MNMKYEKCLFSHWPAVSFTSCNFRYTHTYNIGLDLPECGEFPFNISFAGVCHAINFPFQAAGRSHLASVDVKSSSLILVHSTQHKLNLIREWERDSPIQISHHNEPRSQSEDPSCLAFCCRMIVWFLFFAISMIRRKGKALQGNNNTRWLHSFFFEIIE